MLNNNAIFKVGNCICLDLTQWPTGVLSYKQCSARCQYCVYENYQNIFIYFYFSIQYGTLCYGG